MKQKMLKGQNSRRFLQTLLIRIIVILVCAVLLSGGAWYAWKRYDKQRFTALSALISNELMYCAELTSVKAVYSDVVTLKRQEVLGLAKSYSIIRYSGLIRAGIADLSELIFTFNSDRSSVSVKLPPVQILGNDISSMEIFDEYNNIFAPISSQEILIEINAAKERMGQTFIAQGLIQDAQVQSLLVIRRVLSAMGFKNITVEF